MSAWVLALCCLFSSDASAIRTTPYTALSVYLTTTPSQPLAPLENMKRELSALMQAGGFRIIWGDPRTPDKTGQANLAVLELRGPCAMPPGGYRVEREVDGGGKIAETPVENGVVLPFSFVNCANLTRMIGPALSLEAAAQRDYLYGRALARVVAHELYHVIMGSRDHGQEGVSKATFTTANLLDELFDFDGAALVKLRQRATEGDFHSEPTVDAVTGR